MKVNMRIQGKTLADIQAGFDGLMEELEKGKGEVMVQVGKVDASASVWDDRVPGKPAWPERIR